MAIAEIGKQLQRSAENWNYIQIQFCHLIACTVGFVMSTFSDHVDNSILVQSSEVTALQP